MRELNPKHVIVRSNWVYGAEPGYWLADLLMAARTGTPFPVAEKNTSSVDSCTMEAPTDQAEAARLRAPMAFTR